MCQIEYIHDCTEKIYKNMKNKLTDTLLLDGEGNYHVVALDFMHAHHQFYWNWKEDTAANIQNYTVYVSQKGCKYYRNNFIQRKCIHSYSICNLEVSQYWISFMQTWIVSM